MGNARAEVVQTADSGGRRETIAEPHCTLFTSSSPSSSACWFLLLSGDFPSVIDSDSQPP
jgi:hypothetical protein